MVYFDSDVLINYLVVQDKAKHDTATKRYQEAARQEKFFISLLFLQETSFVLAKLKAPNHEITAKLAIFLTSSPTDYDLDLFKRACSLAEIVGYQHINDCLHTAMAELHCDELLTFNQANFKRINKYTSLKINIL